MTTDTFNLNEHMEPIGSPIANDEGLKNSASISEEYERNSIPAYNIKDFRFDSGSGGTLRLGGNPIGVLEVQATSEQLGSANVSMIRQTENGTIVSEVAYRRYMPGTVMVSDFVQRVRMGTSSNSATYNTLDVYDFAGSNRIAFMQLLVFQLSGTISEIKLSVSPHGVAPPSLVTYLGTTGTGYISMPSGTTDPAGAVNGSQYYNTTTNKCRRKDNAGWADF